MNATPSPHRLSRHVIVGLFALVFSVCLPLAAETAEPIDIADRNQVFLDGRFLDRAENVRIVVCRPKKTNEKCLVGRLGGYSSIMEPDGVFRGFVALTKDGVHWRRVPGGTLPESDDILGLRLGGETVFTDPKAPPVERYKRFSGMKNQIWASADGLKWKELHQGVFPPKACYPRGMDSHNVCFFDTRLEKYVAFVRVNKVYECPPQRVPYFEKLGRQKHGAPNRYARRTIGRAETDDLSSFPMPEVVLEPDDKDPIFGGVRVMDFYCPQVVQYPHAQDAYFLFNCRYRSYEDWYLSIDMTKYPRGSTGVYNCGVEDIGLAAGRDGIHWHRYDRKPVDSARTPGKFRLAHDVHEPGDLSPRR